MLMNFCHPSLLPTVKCNTVSTENYEVTNLINDSDKGFMVYCAVKPPIHIDFKFICKIQLSHIIIWPNVGAQKSSGFKLSVKLPTRTEYEDVCTSFLKLNDQGLFLYRKDFDYSDIAKPFKFLENYLQLSKFKTINYTDNIRISIIKTENSVPAISRIEIWGKVSSVLNNTTKETVEKLWVKRYQKIKALKSNIEIPSIEHENVVKDVNQEQRNTEPDLLNVCEDFLDPITYEIMLKPVILPCGKIIDQSTLEKHEKSEANWGRKPSDPFTGILFCENQKPIAAFSLKERIDRFLLEHRDFDEIKKMPRVLGSKHKKSTLLLNCNFNVKKSDDENVLKKIKLNSTEQKTHNLPLSVLSQPSSTRISSRISVNNNKSSKDEVFNNKLLNISAIRNNFKIHRLKESNIEEITETCYCCPIDKILYKLPCGHKICRKMLLSNIHNTCATCITSYTNSDPVRIHE